MAFVYLYLFNFNNLTIIVSPRFNLNTKIHKGITIALVTCGGEGAYVFTKEGYVHVPAEGGKPVDTTGAGDAFMCGFINKMLQTKIG